MRRPNSLANEPCLLIGTRDRGRAKTGARFSHLAFRTRKLLRLIETSNKMRRIPKAQQSIDYLLTSARQPHRPASLCRACQVRAASLSQTSSFSTSAAARQEEPKPFTEKIRSKLWKTEPPGREDPYDPNSPFKQVKEETVVAEVQEVEVDQALAAQYKPATTWEGLEWVGDKQHLEKLKDSGKKIEG